MREKPKGGDFQGLLSAIPETAAFAKELTTFLQLLSKWNAVCNLIGPLSPEELLRDHVQESLVGASWLLPGLLVDVGSGNGFPALPLLVARRDVQGLLLEPRARRWAFLKEAIRALGLSAQVVRVPVAQLEGVEADNLTVRAVAREVWEARAAGLVRPGGRVLWWAGPHLDHQPPRGFGDVITCPLPNPQRGHLVVWGRCST
jgi:16S rRNA (guanine527-N7)-methyltransferase